MKLSSVCQHENGNGCRNLTMLLLLLDCGLRVSELVSLNRDHIDLERKEFSIKGKGSKVRVVFLSDAAAYWLERYLRVRKDHFKPLFIRYSGAIDERKDGEKMRLTVRSVQSIVETYAKKSGLSMDVTPHTLRHSFATSFLEIGGSLFQLQRLLGHKQLRTTLKYVHLQSENVIARSPLDVLISK